MTARNPCLDAPSPRDQFDRLILINPDDLTGTPECEARLRILEEGLACTPTPARVEDRVIEGERWLAVTMRVWRPRERVPS